jgi:hypothetical protein
MMFQPSAEWREHVERDPVARGPATASQIAYARFPATELDWPDGSPAWVDLAAHQFQEHAFIFRCKNTPDVRGRLLPAFQAAMRGETRCAFDVVAVASYINGGRTLQYKVSLQQVMVDHLHFFQNDPALLEVGMTYQTKVLIGLLLPIRVQKVEMAARDRRKSGLD